LHSYSSVSSAAACTAGELKTLKYDDDAFENASVEFDEESLKPTYRIVWGIPGRSNGLNIAERLGLSPDIVTDARERAGAAGMQARPHP
jgi:dsDNA-specific endonuclease/ATPase MutS2